MQDRDVLTHISELVDEEHRLRSSAEGAGGLSLQDRQRLETLEEQLDQCWDLLRRRRAKEEMGEDPDQERARPVGQVESYLQ